MSISRLVQVGHQNRSALKIRATQDPQPPIDYLQKGSSIQMVISERLLDFEARTLLIVDMRPLHRCQEHL